jgi:radical SAM superfamily enzyme YgiQ (UPF0313 family)
MSEAAMSSGPGIIKVLLLAPPSPVKNGIPPLGLAYLGSILERDGCQVKIVDGAAPLARYTEADLVEIAKTFSPDIVGVTIIINYLQSAYSLIGRLAEVGVLVVAGGPHPTLLPEETLERGAHIVVRGEGEETLPELVEHIRGKKALNQILGISYRAPGGTIVHNANRLLIADLDQILFPARHLFIHRDYVDNGSGTDHLGTILGSRGCPMRCTYCWKHLFGHRLRLRSVENVFREMVHLYHTFGVRSFRFIDDQFTAQHRQVNELCDRLLSSGLSVSWSCITRVDRVTPGLLAKMREAGCTSINYGIESANLATLQKMQRGYTVEEARRGVRWTYEANISCDLNFMWGFPGETAEDIARSIAFLKELAPMANSFTKGGILVPYPGTPIYEEYKERFGFERWWLKTEFADTGGKEVEPPLFRSRFFDDEGQLTGKAFFNYPPDVKRQIVRAVGFINWHNETRRGWLLGMIKIAFLYLSVLLNRLGPGLERRTVKSLYYALSRMWQASKLR